MNPDANSLEQLRNMRLTLSDLPVHGAYRDAIFLREHLSTQMKNSLQLEKSAFATKFGSSSLSSSSPHGSRTTTEDTSKSNEQQQASMSSTTTRR